MAMLRGNNDVNANVLVKKSSSDVNFTLSDDTLSIDIEKVDTSSSNWKIIQTEDYRPDKRAFIEEQFSESYPKFGKLDYDMITALASRSKVISKWLTISSQKYTVEVDPPLWLQSEISAEEFKEIKPKITLLSKAASDRAEAEAKAASEYKNKLARIERDFSDKVSAMKKDSNLLKILSMSSTDLPITLQLAIENFTPSSAESAPNQRMFAREILTSYRISLIKYSKTNPDMDIQTVIDRLAPL